MTRYYTTPMGYQRFAQRLEGYRQQYFQVCSSNADAADAGDNSVWHDNFAYEENQRQMAQLSKKIHEMEKEMELLDVVPVPVESDQVRLGCQVDVINLTSGAEWSYLIAGWGDGDPGSRRVSYNSPLGSCLLGSEPGDERSVVVSGRTIRYQVVAVASSPPGEL